MLLPEYIFPEDYLPDDSMLPEDYDPFPDFPSCGWTKAPVAPAAPQVPVPDLSMFGLVFVPAEPGQR